MSAMSEFHDPIGNIRIGNHPRVSALMSGIFNKRPQVSIYLGCRNCFRFSKEAYKLLTFKVSMLLSLLSASRVSKITNLRVDYLTKHSSV